MGKDGSNWHLALAYDEWVALSVSGPRPPARYKHAATVIDEKLYITGGSRNGRYLSDVQVFDLINLVWCTLKLQLEPSADKTKDSSSQEVLPPTSGHSMIYWAGKLLLLGGLSKNDSGSVTVRSIDLESHHYGVMETFGKVPVARSGQSVTTVGSRLIMFGGEDRNRQLLNDVHVLDLETMTWDVLETTQPPPSPRFDHTAAVHAERYLLIFGGCSHSIFFNDLHVLDLQTMEWSQPQIQGDLVTARAGHAGITIDDKWYIVGGGDNKNGAPETLMLNMPKLVLLVLTSVKERDALASEGLSVSSAVLNGEKLLVAFGGYNGNYNNEVFVMRPKPRDSSHPKIFQSAAAAAAAASVTAAYALTQPGKLDFTETEDSNYKLVKENGSQQDISLDIKAIREENKVLESLLGEFKAENSSLKEKIEGTSSTYAELFKEFRSFKGQLGAERSRCANLEAQIAELQKMLESRQSIEEEVQVHQRQALEHEVELAAAVQRQSSGGVWKWVTG